MSTELLRKYATILEGTSPRVNEVSLSDIGKPVLVRGETGFILLAVSYHSGNGGLVATVLDRNHGNPTPQDFELESVSPAPQNI